ncbi:MAG TPA: hypothetical protein PLB62_06415, partial [Candidatus Sumerlaeota bacterium]|nr:hypothetical protein [Candidatus Sumerlaeota bacterium]
EQSTGLSIATALSNRQGRTLPWKAVQDLLNSALNARFLELTGDSGAWPCDFSGAKTVRFRVSSKQGLLPDAVTDGSPTLVASDYLETHQIQDLGDNISKLMDLKTKADVPLKVFVKIELGDGKEIPPADLVAELNKILNNLKKGFGFKYK